MLAVLVIIAIIAASWLLASLLLEPPENLMGSRIDVLAVAPGQVTLVGSVASARPGTAGH